MSQTATILAPETDSMTELFGEPIYSYTRKQALEDGFQVAVDAKTSAEAGFKFPVFINRTVWEKFVVVPEGVEMQDEAGRLWDVLWMLRCAIRQGGSEIFFKLHVRNSNRAGMPRATTLKALCGPTDIDDARPAITIMLPEEN